MPEQGSYLVICKIPGADIDTPPVQVPGIGMTADSSIFCLSPITASESKVFTVIDEYKMIRLKDRRPQPSVNLKREFSLKSAWFGFRFLVSDVDHNQNTK